MSFKSIKDEYETLLESQAKTTVEKEKQRIAQMGLDNYIEQYYKKQFQWGSRH